MEETESIANWESIGNRETSEYFFHTLSTITGWEFIREYKQMSFEMLGLHREQRVLDVGCGLGDDLMSLATLVGPEGQVVGVDKSEAMIVRARELLEDRPHNAIKLMVADATNLMMQDNSFDACRADRVLQHVSNRGAVLSEMIRVLRPGGRLVSIDPDWETLVFDVSDVDLTRKVCAALCDRVRNGWAAHQTPGMFSQHGLTKVTVVPITSILNDSKLARAVLEMDRALEELEKAQILTSQEVTRWFNCLEEADQNERFFGAMTGFITLGVKSL